jgi:hypothetical protein
MSRLLPAVAGACLLALLPRSAPAQAGAALAGWNRVQAYNALYAPSGPAKTPFGKVVNPTQTPEWRQGGNNWQGYMAVMQQKMAAAEARELNKRMQEVDRWLARQADLKSKGKPVDPRYDQLLRNQAEFQRQLAAASHPRLRRPAPAKKTATKPASETKPTPQPSASQKADAKLSMASKL